MTTNIIKPLCQHCRQATAIARNLCHSCWRRQENGQRIRDRYPLQPSEVRPTVCVHCKLNKVHRPRGLCWTCYYSVENGEPVRELYPPTSKFARRGHGDCNRNVLPAEPTDAAPGSPLKVEILSIRARNHENLFHPRDAYHEGSESIVRFITPRLPAA